MKKALKRVLCGVMAAAMLLGLQIGAGAAVQTSQRSTMTGRAEFVNGASISVWTIQFPAQREINFIIDPQQLVRSDSARFNDVKVDSAARVLFPAFSDGTYQLHEYNGVSSVLEVKNKGTTDVIVNLNAMLTDTNLEIASLANFSDTDTERAGIYMAATNSDGLTAPWTALGYTGVTYQEEVKKTDGSYVPFYHRDDGAEQAYEFILSDEVLSDADYKWNSAKFRIKGDVNSAGNWAEADLVAPNVKFEWAVRNSDITSVAIANPPAATNGTYTVSVKSVMGGDVIKIWVHPNKNYAISDPPEAKWTSKASNGELEDNAELKVVGSAEIVNGAKMYTITVPDLVSKYKEDGTTANQIVFTAPTFESTL